MNRSEKNLRTRLLSLFENKFFLIFLALVGSFIWAEQCMGSFFYRCDSTTDSSVFRYVAYAMSKGQIPYKDIFDHKGPLLYVINYLGFLINKEYGVWFLEYITLFITICFLFMIANKACKNNCQAVLSVFASLSLLSQYFEGGNFTEEYAMPLIAIAIYVFQDYFANHKVSPWKLILCGLCGGGVLMLRPNMAVVWLVFPLFVVIDNLIRKDFLSIFVNGFFFVAGVILAIAPFILYYKSIGALGDLDFAYIDFNLLYSAATFTDKFRIFLSFSTPLVLLSFITVGVYLLTGKYSMFNIAYIVCIPIALYILSISGRNYGHYGMVLIPLLPYPIGLLLSKCQKGVTDNVILYTLICISLVSWLDPTIDCIKHVTNDVSSYTDNNTATVVDYIVNHTNEDDRIIVIGNKNIFYLKCNRLSASRYSYQLPLANIDYEVPNEFYKDLKHAKPAAIIVPRSETDFIGLQEFIEEYQYSEVFQNSQYFVYQSD